MNKKLLSIAAILIGVVLFIGLNIVGASLFRGARTDLTQGKLYTLSKGSRAIASKLDEPIRLTLYLSEKQANAMPDIKSYAIRVREFLSEYAAASGGKIKLQVVDPEPFSETEDKANQAGLFGTPVGPGNERLYFGLVATNLTDRQEVVRFFDPAKEQFLEYDITRLIYLLSNPQKKVVGVMASLPINGVPNNPMMRGQDTPPWAAMNMLRDLFEVRNIAPDSGEVPSDIDVLMVVHPKNWSDKTLYEIDQFVLRGGRLIVFVDPWCEADLPPGIDPMQAMNLPRGSNLPKLFEAWGIEMIPERFAADRDAAVVVQVGSQQRPERADYLAWLRLMKGRGNLSATDAATGQLEMLTMGIAGILTKKPGATITFEPIIETGTRSMAMGVQLVQFMPDPKRLLGEFAEGGAKLTLAARITGKIKSAFPEGDPAAAAPEEGQPAPAPLKESAGDANIVVVADCDMLSDRFWVTENRLGNLMLGYSKVADNGDFLVAALDNLSGSSDLLSLRARGQFYRPFDRVDQIRKDAQDRFLAEEQRLRDELRRVEASMNDLMQRQGPQSGGVILTPEMKAELDKLQNQKVEVSKNLRNVSHQMRKDIERLGKKLEFINVGLMPLAVGVLAIGLSMYRANRRRSIRASDAGK